MKLLLTLLIILTVAVCAVNLGQSKHKNQIVIQPFSGVSANKVVYVYEKLLEVYPNVTITSSVSLPNEAYYAPRNRYKAHLLRYWLNEQRTTRREIVVGITASDISSKKDGKDWGIRGQAYLPGYACIVSTFRLSKKNADDQLFKLVLHELGHNFGLLHCPVTTCYMKPYGNRKKKAIDGEIGFCMFCKTILKKQGWKL